MIHIKEIPNKFTQHFAENACEISFQLTDALNSTKPVIVILHALTGNSSVCGDNGWWKEIVGNKKTIDTNKFNILSIDTLGNGYATQSHTKINTIENIRIGDIAKINLWLIEELKLTNIYALIGGSLGGALAWEMWRLNPNYFDKLFCIAVCPLQDQWIKAITFLQQNLMLNNETGFEQARMWSMLFYRNALGIHKKFDQNNKQINDWLLHHGQSLSSRFNIKSYMIMNHLLGAIGSQIKEEDLINVVKESTTEIICISISSDWLFHPTHQKNLIKKLKKEKANIIHHSLVSEHGHDAFLIEFKKLEKIITPYL